MPKARVLGWLAVFAAGFGFVSVAKGAGDSSVGADTLVIRLVHPDGQAAEVLKLFDGARVAHPAAALVGWKRATRDANPLGKPLEAAIAMLNPEMVREWKGLHDAVLCVDPGTVDGSLHWYAVVPHDDGVFSAAVTAMRMTEGATLKPLVTGDGKEFAVERLGPAADAMVAARSVDTLIVASSRDDLERGLRRIGNMRSAVAAEPALAKTQRILAGTAGANGGDFGLAFDFHPGRMNPQAGTTTNRRAAAFFQGIGCQQIHGRMALEGDILALEMTSRLKRQQPSTPPLTPPAAAAGPAVIEPSWLAWVPARDVMGVVSVACQPDAPFWNAAFAVADRVDRADPARSHLSPLRLRFNLLAAAAGMRPEVDLWPHLRGVTACVMADSRQPGSPGGVLVVLHMDADASAERLTKDVLPRLTALLTGKRPDAPALRKAAPDRAAAAPAEAPAELGRIGGRLLIVSRHGRDVLIASGNEILSAAKEAAGSPDHSVARICTHWATEGKKPPQRLGAFWPGRFQPPVATVDAASPAWRALANDPPAVWWGWTGPDQAQDSIRYGGLKHRLHHFLNQLPLDPSPIR